MKQILNEWNKFVLNETSISRIHEHTLNHETAFISAHRNDATDFSKCRPDSSTIEENYKRNQHLKATLMNYGYGVTDVDGIYVEGFDTEDAVEVNEDSFFVVNLPNDADFYKKLFDLSEHYCQDSFLYVPRGGKGALLVGTNNDDYPGYAVSKDSGNFIGGKEGQFMSRVGKTGRPVKFAEGLETKAKKQNNTKYLISTLAEKVMKELEDKKNK